MLTQLQLPIRLTVPGAPAEDRLRELVSTLRGRGWVTSAELGREGFTDRELRAIVESDKAGQILSYPGSPGYKLFDEATLPEIDRISALRSQARGMLSRWLRYQNRRHRTPRP